MARLVLLPPHDPQYRRNRERVIRDAERENILLEWDLGVPEEEPVEPTAAPAEDTGTVSEAEAAQTPAPAEAASPPAEG
jgi:hypothetical protein